MPDSTEVNTGAVGSIVMIVLTVAFVILLVSFYRRYKRASQVINSETPHEEE